jgi:hypothetical protein
MQSVGIRNLQSASARGSGQVQEIEDSLSFHARHFRNGGGGGSRTKTAYLESVTYRKDNTQDTQKSGHPRVTFPKLSQFRDQQ